MDETNQELIFKLSMFEQQIRNLQEQLQAVERNIIDFDYLKNGLDEFKKAEGKEILAPVGKGIFLKSKITSEDLIVDVGNRNFVKKDINSTKDMIESQIKKLDEVKNELEVNLEALGEELNRLISESN